MSSLPPDFLSAPVSDVKVTRIDFANTPLTGYAGLQAYIIDDVFTSSECATLLSAAEANSPWRRAMIQIGNGRQRHEDDQRKCGRLIWDSPNVAQKIWDRVKVYVPDRKTGRTRRPHCWKCCHERTGLGGNQAERKDEILEI